jgi:hypothetical protein
MDYKFIETIHGPAVLGEDEVVYFTQPQELLDYLDADPEFLTKAKLFVSEGFKETATQMADSLTKQVIGGDRSQAIYGYVNAVQHLHRFEFQFLPGLPGYQKS